MCPTAQLKKEESEMGGDEYEEGGDDGVKVELVKVLDENKDEDRSPAPVVYGIVNRKLFCSPKFFPKSSGPAPGQKSMTA